MSVPSGHKSLNGRLAQTGLPRELFPLSKMESESLYSSPFDTFDGNNFMVRVPLDAAGRPLNVIDNWPALIKQ